MLRGEEAQRPKVMTSPQRGVGKLIDNEGQTQYHIVTSWWANLVIAGFGVLLGLCLILMIFIYQNRSSLNTLEQKVDHNENRIERHEEEKK